MFEDADDLAGFFNEDDFGLAARYRVAGAGLGKPVTLVASRGDRGGDIGGFEVSSREGIFLVRKSEVAAPAAGDTFTIGAVVHRVQGEPRLDAEQVIWTIEAPG